MVKNQLHTKTILLVDDEPELLKLMGAVLYAEGFTNLVCAKSVSQALEVYQKTKPDLAILDVGLPDGDGFSLCAYLRALDPHNNLPVIFLTARDETSDRLTGLRSGADDYITKPFSPQEVILRVIAVLRRCYPEASPVYELAYCTLNLDNVEVIRKDGDRAFLTAKERAILAVLAENAGRIVTTDQICEAAWGSTFGYEQSLQTHVRRIREKIEENPSSPTSLVTVKGLGYKLLLA